MNLILSTCLKSPFPIFILVVLSFFFLFLCVCLNRVKERKSLFKLTLSHLKEFHFFSECPCRSFFFFLLLCPKLGVESATCVILLCWQCHRYYDVGFSIMFALWSFFTHNTHIHTCTHLMCVLFHTRKYQSSAIATTRWCWDWKACVA